MSLLIYMLLLSNVHLHFSSMRSFCLFVEMMSHFVMMYPIYCVAQVSCALDLIYQKLFALNHANSPGL